MFFPIEIWKYLITYLPIDYIFVIGIVNKELRNSLLNNNYYQYYIHLKYPFLKSFINTFQYKNCYQILSVLHICDNNYYKTISKFIFEKNVKINVINQLRPKILNSSKEEREKHPLIKFDLECYHKLIKQIKNINSILNIMYNDYIMNCKIKIITIFI